MKPEIELLKEENANLIRHIKSNHNQISEMGKMIDELRDILKSYDNGEDERITKALGPILPRLTEAHNKPQ